ncbi:tRNA uracil 4-sulfurtransferase ThiI [Fictibacillus enclensis]|uniref:tRNA uracil 4-sulfurtransferase ThiI n=1 Tax=Fictibacillus enclensis TaxID=1017270 RepID=UPI0024BFEF3E|nr:tRNA uracil 4-sulfurtransferase ThiI [Fictibacillus enclensis]MDM5339401.1 tRNA uracil 4-sulfurtransferase ThiI [Fictibacillus enclensis]WHY70850.1 tRNA uracil 4-sulfurtransferase ThiI [Fictibacillus enclensis]
MQYNHIVIRFGELSLKGKNRRHFESQLRETVRKKLSPFTNAVVLKSYDRILVEINGEDHEKMIAKLQEVFGIHAISLAIRAENELESIKEAALATFLKNGQGPKTFKVSARRSNKHFPVGSMELNREVGGHILKNTENVSVDVHHPDIDVKVEVKDNGTFISCETYPGAGGLPIGVGGKALLMLSGGIDSPVAGYLTMKRGVRLEAVHFHSPPFTSERARQKAEDLMQELTRYGGKMKLHIVHFTKIQQIIKEKIPASYSMTIMRRMMLRIAERIAEERNAMAIANGENLGQVASQTMYSMHTINEVTNLPIIRPVVTMDKLEIIDISQKIGTYDISIRPYEDCCTIFVPAAPKTKPKREKANRFEQAIENMDELIQEAVDTIETVTFEEQKEQTEFEDLF